MKKEFACFVNMSHKEFIAKKKNQNTNFILKIEPGKKSWFYNLFLLNIPFFIFFIIYIILF